ncbi:DNA internalization-related competence protein ComEC/Rec2 [Shewanella japonica]
MINRFIYGFCASMLFSNLLPSLLPIWMASITLIIVLVTFKKWSFISGTLFGVLLVSICFNSLFSSQESNIPVKKQFKAEIVSLVSVNSDWISFDIRLLSEQSRFYDHYYRLIWQQPPELKVGQTWLLNARLKPITSPLNQGGFNQQKYLLSRHIVAKGTVKQGELVAYFAPFRQTIIDNLTPVLRSLDNSAVMQALLFGDKSLLSKQQWQQLRQTGTGHLVAISGLHLSVVFGLFLLLSRGMLFTCWPHSSRRNLLLSMLTATVFALGYGYLAGFAISTQRALVMLLALVVLTMVNQYASTWQRLIWALFAVLLIDPFASLSAGFWLSFSALAIILLTIDYTSLQQQTALSQESDSTDCIDSVDSNREQPSLYQRFVQEHQTRFRRLISQCKAFIVVFWAVQWRLALALGLVQAVLFGTFSFHSIWVNFLMVPWFSFVVIPLSIIALVLNLLLMIMPIPQNWSYILGETVMQLADLSLSPFQWLIGFSDAWPLALMRLPDNLILSVAFFILGLFLIKWSVHKTWRVVSSLLCIPFVMLTVQHWTLHHIDQFQHAVNEPIITDATLKPIHWQAHVIDVAQGMSVLLQQGNRGVLYDTGAAYGESFSYAERAIVPMLQAKGVTQLDYVIVSHNDNDHAGGLNVITKHYPEVIVIAEQAVIDKSINVSSELANEAPAHLLCENNQIKWLNLTIEMHINTLESNDNNRSCVAYIIDTQRRLFLAGDIEKETEYEFLKREVLAPVDVLLAPHHGSRTSSTLDFIDAVSPKHVIFTAGYANQYGFPKEDIQNRYKLKGAKTLVSGDSGQISIDFEPSNYAIREYRSDIAPFWYNSLFRFGEKVKAE